MTKSQNYDLSALNIANGCIEGVLKSVRCISSTTQLNVDFSIFCIQVVQLVEILSLSQSYFAER